MKSSEVFAFRTKPRLDPKKLDVEIAEAQDLKWVVLESCPPEELMLAAVAVKVERLGGSRVGVLRCLSVLPSRQGSGIGGIMLRRVESVCRGLGCSSARLDVARVRENIRVFFSLSLSLAPPYSIYLLPM